MNAQKFHIGGAGASVGEEKKEPTSPSSELASRQRRDSIRVGQLRIFVKFRRLFVTHHAE